VIGIGMSVAGKGGAPAIKGNPTYKGGYEKQGGNINWGNKGTKPKLRY